VTKFQVSTILTCHTIDGQMHSIGKAIRSLFAESVTIVIAFNNMMRILNYLDILYTFKIIKPDPSFFKYVSPL